MARPKVRDLFGRSGYVRVPNEQRQGNEGHRRYKKGWEVRLVAADEDEVRAIERMAASLGYPPGASFRKGRQYIVPIYGKAAVEAFQRAHVPSIADELVSERP